jgi:NCS1 family nucleobase:cation symporter-1
MLLMAVPCVPFVFWPQELFDLGDKFLAYNGTMYAPISGILFADYFFLRKQKLNLRALFESDPSGEYYFHRGFNWIALGSLLLGQVIYIVLYNPYSGETHPLAQFFPASVAASVVPALIYGAGMRLLNRHKSARSHPPTGPDAPGNRRLISPNV